MCLVSQHSPSHLLVRTEAQPLEMQTWKFWGEPGIFSCVTYMWQSRVEIEGYSVAYFDRIVAFEAPYRSTFVKGGAHMRFVDS